MKKLIKKIKILSIKAFVGILNRLAMKNKLNHVMPRRFLVIATTGIGDTLWGTPAIAALKKTYPGSWIGVLTNPQGFELLKGNPCINRLFIFKRGASGFALLPILLNALRQDRFDTAFIFHASDRIIWLLVYLSGASEIIGIEGQNKDIDFILTKTISPQNTVHGIKARLNIVKQVGAGAASGATSIYLSDEEIISAIRLLKENGIDEGTLLIGLHPGAQKPYKCWPPENFIAIGNTLSERLGCKIIVTGSSDEKRLADTVASGIRGATPLAGRLSLRQTAAVIKRINIFITNDTGPMHIAFALGTPTVALFCPTDPKLCGPYEAEGAEIIEKPKICAHCISKKCYNPICMMQITPQEVASAVESILNKNKNAYNTELQA
jgi:lipopolysaccharide heptosyltransferase II